jgi:hypothetical protein
MKPCQDKMVPKYMRVFFPHSINEFAVDEFELFRVRKSKIRERMGFFAGPEFPGYVAG